jgi:hypothetical protein
MRLSRVLISDQRIRFFAWVDWEKYEKPVRIAGVYPFSSQCFEGVSEPDTSKVKHRNIIASDSLRRTFISFHYAVDVFLGVDTTRCIRGGVWRSSVCAPER